MNNLNTFKNRNYTTERGGGGSRERMYKWTSSYRKAECFSSVLVTSDRRRVRKYASIQQDEADQSLWLLQASAAQMTLSAQLLQVKRGGVGRPEDGDGNIRLMDVCNVSARGAASAASCSQCRAHAANHTSRESAKPAL